MRFTLIVFANTSSGCAPSLPTVRGGRDARAVHEAAQRAGASPRCACAPLDTPVHEEAALSRARVPAASFRSASTTVRRLREHPRGAGVEARETANTLPRIRHLSPLLSARRFSAQGAAVQCGHAIGAGAGCGSAPRLPRLNAARWVEMPAPGHASARTRPIVRARSRDSGTRTVATWPVKAARKGRLRGRDALLTQCAKRALCGFLDAAEARDLAILRCLQAVFLAALRPVAVVRDQRLGLRFVYLRRF